MRILFFRIGAIGDVLLTTPAVKFLKENLNAEIHYLTSEKPLEILKNNPYIDRLILFEEKNKNLPRFLRVLSWQKWYKNTFKEKYDYIIDFESSYYSTYITLFIPTQNRYGFKIKNKRRFLYNYFYNKRLDYNENKYVAHKFLELASLLVNKKYSSLNLILKLTEEEINRGKDFFRKNKIGDADVKIMLSISGTWTSKKWPINNWLRLIDIFKKYNKNIKIIILWGPGDENDLNKFKNVKNIYIIPKTTIREISSIIYHGSLVISNDNGIRHIAKALNVKTIGLFGPTNEIGWSEQMDNILTYNIDCRPCNKTHCKNNLCMINIYPEKVFEIVKKVI